MRTKVISVVVVCVAMLAVTSCDSTAPTFAVPTHVGFVVGGQIGASDALDNDGMNDFTYSIPRLLQWSATDNDSACQIRYDVEEVPAGGPPNLILQNDPRTQFAVIHSDYNGDFGGGAGEIEGWNVIAHDCSGNSTVSGHFMHSNVWQETGHNPRGDGRPPTIAFSGTWTTQTGSWASGSQQKFTTGLNASVSFTKEFLADQHIGLVMAQGPARGSADIYVDNVKVGTVNTYATVNDNRRIFFDRKMTAGSHTVKIVDQATAGHPRIDIDAFLT